MKRKNQISRLFVCSFSVLIILFISANFVFAQCGNYFKTKYSQTNKINNAILETDALDDWNGDGRADLWNFRGNPSTSLRDIVIYPGKPTGYWDFDNPIIYTTTIPTSQAGNFEVKDFNSDGRTDLLYGTQIYRNTGNGSLSGSPSFYDSEGFSMQIIGFTDLNGDNLLDVIYFVFTGSFPNYIIHLRYQTQNTDGSFSNKTTIMSQTPQNGLSQSMILGDVNGDGKIDIIYDTSEIGNQHMHAVILNRGGGNFELQPPVASDLYARTFLVEDFNNDGKVDVVGSGSANLVIFYGQANGTFNRQVFSGISYGNPAELNGDNNPDLILINTNFYTVVINNGAGGFNQTTYQKPLGSVFGIKKIEDFSGDGKADLLFKYDSTFNRTINIFGEKLLYIKENVCQSFGETKVANFDSDDIPDATLWNPNSGNWFLKNAQWESGSNPPVRTFHWGAGALGDVPAPGDFDGDGKTDYSVYRNSTGVWYILRSSDSAWMSFRFGLTGDIPAPNDYDGGGKTDIAVFRPSDGNWYIWQSETQQFTAYHFGQNGDKPVPADYDGDGKTDIAVFRPNTGVWYYLKSSDGNFGVFQWGIETDVPIPADYDGDLKADFTVYRNGVWWIFRSSNNTYSLFYWGTSGDIPAPIYRNSISAEVIVYRPSDNRWYNLSYLYSGTVLSMNGNQGVPVYFGLPNN